MAEKKKYTAEEIKAYKSSSDFKSIAAEAKKVVNDLKSPIEVLFVSTVPDSKAWRLSEATAEALWGTNYEKVEASKAAAK